MVAGTPPGAGKESPSRQGRVTGPGFPSGEGGSDKLFRVAKFSTGEHNRLMFSEIPRLTQCNGANGITVRIRFRIEIPPLEKFRDNKTARTKGLFSAKTKRASR